MLKKIVSGIFVCALINLNATPDDLALALNPKCIVIKDLDLRAEDLSEKNLSNKVFISCDFRGANLSKANCTKTSFIDCIFVDANFNEALFIGANFYLCNLLKALGRCNLDKASFDELSLRSRAPFLIREDLYPKLVKPFHLSMDLVLSGLCPRIIDEAENAR
jgi:uncharacterized protein YjbI with pentapeptide repeats